MCGDRQGRVLQCDLRRFLSGLRFDEPDEAIEPEPFFAAQIAFGDRFGQIAFAAGFERGSVLLDEIRPSARGVERFFRPIDEVQRAPEVGASYPPRLPPGGEMLFEFRNDVHVRPTRKRMLPIRVQHAPGGRRALRRWSAA